MYLSSCQKEFASKSGSTRVAFMIRAAKTALQIYNIQGNNWQISSCKKRSIKERTKCKKRWRYKLQFVADWDHHYTVLSGNHWFHLMALQKGKEKKKLFPFCQLFDILKENKNEHTRPLWAGSWRRSPTIRISILPKVFYIYLHTHGKNINNNLQTESIRKTSFHSS